jgi:primary-amine oxidase
MSAPTRHWLRSAGTVIAIVLLGAAVPVAINVAADADGTFNCSGGFQVDETLTNGARWQMCWEKRAREGIVLHDVTYTPVGGQPVEILSEAALAQIHVPYDDNGARFHDLSDYGLGNNMDALSAGDCPNGTLLSNNWLCQTEAPAGYAYKSYNEVADSTSLNLFSASCIGAYCYVVAWNFDDDGTIRPEVGATGQLQRTSGRASAGWPIGGGRNAVAHMHNYYWRLDFDVNGVANDRAEELEARFAPGTGRQELNNTRQAFSTEVARRVAAGGFRSWRVRDTVTVNGDNHPISFELLPDPDNIFRGPTYEPWTQNELYVTRNRSCERFASHNPTNGGCPSSLAGFANGQSLTGQDLVVWYGTSFHHLPRDEDEPHMHPHWSGFSIVPRDLTATNPAG